MTFTVIRSRYEKKIVWDVDDTLWALTEKVVQLAGIDKHKVTEYLVSTIRELTAEEVETIHKLYGQLEVFEGIQRFDGIQRIRDIQADNYICSNNINEAVLRQKTEGTA